MITFATPEAELDIDDALIDSLLQTQYPEFAGLPLGTRFEGWDNVTVRLGDDLAVRLPRRLTAAAQATTELDWLPRVSAQWSFPFPRPLHLGAPQAGFPWRWSIMTWLEGVEAADAPLSARGAQDLGRALAQVHGHVGDGAPHNPFRSTALIARAERFDLRLEAVVARFGGSVRPDVARAIFERGVAAEPGPITVAHLDVHGRNVITIGGRLAGILDWGDAAAGDPAADLGQALVLVGEERFGALSRAYAHAGGAAANHHRSLPQSTISRVHAEAVMYALFLAGIDDEVHSKAGWAALAELGVAETRR